MEQERSGIRWGIFLILLAASFRLLGSGVPRTAAKILTDPQTVSLLLYLQTGRTVRPMAAVEEVIPEETTAAVPTAPPEEGIVHILPDFSKIGGLTLRNTTDYEPELQTLYEKPLSWALSEEKPTVLILHTHATESYTKTAGENYRESSPYRTLDKGYNMVAIGERVAQVLEQGGIQVIHDTAFHDYPEYSGSYGRSRQTVERCLAQYPSVSLVLDLHRDAADGADGYQMNTAATVDGKPAAQLMLVVGTGADGLEHPSWQRNLSVALKLQAVLEQKNPGLCRPINLRGERFNQDLLPGVLLVEVGAAGDTQEEALTAAQALAEGILTLAYGAVTEYSADQTCAPPLLPE
ncbi:MAG: stage II sporulation protein P [Oscillospiraceae bacterium]|nr:stage II sporulation protein P [Oscillospiraceae bacterium]